MTESTAPLLESRDARGVVTLTMNRPATFNALGEEMLDALQAAFDRLADDGALRALLSPVVGQFDRVWYGHAPFGADEFALMEGQLSRLRQMEGAR